MKHLTKTLVFLLLVLASSSAWAMPTCKRSDLKGDWRLHFTLVNENGFFAGSCAMRVKSSGKILLGGECANARFRVPVIGGKFRVDRNCRVSGVIKFPDNLVLGTVWSSSMNESKNTMAGVLLQSQGEGTFVAMRHKDLSAKSNARTNGIAVGSPPTAFEMPLGGIAMAGQEP